MLGRPVRSNVTALPQIHVFVLLTEMKYFYFMFIIEVVVLGVHYIKYYDRLTYVNGGAKILETLIT